MKKVLIIAAMTLFVVTQAFAADFAPTVMNISAPQYVQYNFDGSNLSIPIQITGTPANVIFLVFTKDQANSVSMVKNGYLGWHYVNKIDTCVYAAAPQNYNIGSTNITWNGKNDDGNAVDEGEYTYYIWGYDNVNFKIPITKSITPDPWGRITLLTHDESGAALAKPILIGPSGRRAGAGADKDSLVVGMPKKWIIGSDPEDATFLETTSILTQADPGGYAFDPSDQTIFFSAGLDNIGNKIVRSWKWIPNGAAIKQVGWGDDGEVSFPNGSTSGWEFGPGAVSDGGDYILTANSDLSGAMTEAEIVYFDVNDGTEIQRLDLSDWYVSLDDAANNGQSSSGPATLNMWGKYCVTGAHSTCMNLLFDTAYEDADEAVMWANDNGDYTGDHNFEEDSQNPWVCNDYVPGPYKYNIPIEKNGFSFFPSYDMGAVSFGLYAPDGTGLSYHALSGETAAQKLDTSVISYGSAYDGLMVSNNSAADAATRAGWYWVGQDTVKGTITTDVAVDEAPSAFAVSQNSPNPFNPTTTISFTTPEAGNVSVDVFNVAGQKIDTVASDFMSAGSHSVTWNASGFSAGVYFYTIKAGDFSKTMKMTLLK